MCNTGASSEKEKKNDQHQDFTASHLHHYYPGSKPLNFRVLMGSDVLDLIWPIVIVMVS